MQDFYNAFHPVWTHRYENLLKLDENNQIKPMIIKQHTISPEPVSTTVYNFQDLDSKAVSPKQ
jgi:hypothetical protein